MPRSYGTLMKPESLQAGWEEGVWWERGSYFYNNFPNSSWCAARNAKHWMKERSKESLEKSRYIKCWVLSRVCCSMMTAIQKGAKTWKCFPMIWDISCLSPKCQHMHRFLWERWGKASIGSAIFHQSLGQSIGYANTNLRNISFT